MHPMHEFAFLSGATVPMWSRAWVLSMHKQMFVVSSMMHVPLECDARQQDKFLLSADTLSSRQLNTVKALVRLGSEAKIRPEVSVQTKYLQFLTNCKGRQAFCAQIIHTRIILCRLLVGTSRISWATIHLGCGLFYDVCELAFFHFLSLHIAVQSSRVPCSPEGWSHYPAADGNHRYSSGQSNSSCSHPSVPAHFLPAFRINL